MIKAKFLCALGLSLCCASINAQELPPALRDSAMVLLINTKVAENNKEVWNAQNSRITIPGRPVNIKLVGENLVIEIYLTPRFQQGKYTLFAQCQVWINIPNRGVIYKTSSDSSPINFGEPILYFPLGSAPGPDTPLIELNLTVYRYEDVPEGIELPSRPSGSRNDSEHRNR